MVQQQIHRLIQVTDSHIGENREHLLAGICTYDTFRQVLADIATLTDRPDMLMVSGDVAALGNQHAYRLFAEQIRFVDIPYAWLPGNHDDFELMQKSVTSAPYWPLLEFGDWRVISLNSAVSGQVGGTLSDSELDFLASTLDNESVHPVIIFVHHPPVPVGCQWLDQQRISNAGELEKIVASANNVKAIFCGHVHQESEAAWAGCQVYTTPSTCFQFTANSPQFSMSDDCPAYRWIDLHSDGHLETGVHHLDIADHKVDHQVQKY
jgi:3',5'-cyclic-AMP phosphodiesterase